MNITSVLLKKVISESDSETWSHIRKHYVASEYHAVYKAINKYFEDFSKIPSFDALILSTRSDAVVNKIYAIQAAEDVDVTTTELLEYLKNEYTQKEIMDQLAVYLDESIMMESAGENLEKLQQIILHIEDRVDLKDPREDMQKIPLFDSLEEIEAAFALGLNGQFDSTIRFSPRDYILIGGKRGSGKSLTCSNIAVNTYNSNKSSIYFTIEMSTRSTLQRMCSVATGVSATGLRNRKLSHGDWLTVAKWWSDRFDGGSEAFAKYKEHQSFDKLHQDLTKYNLHKEKQLDIVYDPSLTLAKIKSELDKKVDRIKPAVILIDYVNQVKRSNSGYGAQYDWTEQIEVSKALKAIAQEYEVPVVSPYQTDATGEARFAKGLLDSADAAFSLNAWNKTDNCITFDCVKMRDNDEVSFTSKIDWNNLRIGPETVLNPDQKEATEKSTEDVRDV